MQQENEFFRLLFDDAPLPYQSLDSEGRILTVNKAWQTELKYEKHEVLGRWFGDFIHSDQRETFRERFRQFVEEGSVQGIVWQLQRKDGSTLHVSYNGRIAKDETSRFLRTQCMFFDLSRRSEAEVQLRESEELRTAFMDAADEGFALYDAQLRLIYVNPAAVHLFGSPECELLGRTLSELSPGVEETDRYAQYRRVIDSGEAFSIEEYQGLPHSDGDWYAVHVFKVGENMGVIWRDITDLKCSEQKLQESEARWRSMAEGSPDHVLILDQELKIEYVNFPSPGLTIDQLIGTPLYEYVAPAEQDSVRLLLQTVFDTGEPASYGTEYSSPEGSTISYESRAVPRIANGQTVGLLVSSRDITSRKQDADRIERLLKRETAMAALALDFGRATSLIDVYRTTYRQVRAVMPADGFIISRFDSANALLHASFLATDGAEQSVAALPPIALASDGKGLQSQVVRTGKPIIVAGYSEAMEESETIYHVSGDGAEVRKLNRDDQMPDSPQSMLLVSMRIRDEIVGVMQVQAYKPDIYRSEDAELLAGLASITAVAIENRNLVQQSQESYAGIIRALAKAIELRDPYTSQHQEGVAHLAVGIARALSISGERIRAIELAANIHDIGKVIIPSEILSKPSTLTNAQMSIVQSHVLASHEVLAGIDFPWPIDEIVIQHHERLDGSGYPAGIRGDEILLEARILGVADIADAMMSHRPHRPAFSLEDTLAELMRLRGSALDPAVVDACVEMLRIDAASTDATPL